MSDRHLGTDLVAKLEDLIKQATTERSHFYVAATAGEAVRELKRLRAHSAVLERVEHYFYERYGLVHPEAKMDEDSIVVLHRVQQVLRHGR